MKLIAKNLTKFYGKRKVVDDISLEINPAEIVGLLGPNGAGKTTTFYMIMGIVTPNSGKVFLDDMDITKMPMYLRVRHGVGYLSQEPALLRKLTVEENLLISIESDYNLRKRKFEILSDLLNKFGLKEVRKQPVYTLSGGERRRCEIARAFVKKPKFLLLDEPFLGIDPVTVEDIQKLIFVLKNEGVGIIITDHNIYETIPIVDRAYIIYEGKIFAEGDAKSLIDNKEVRDIYLGEKIKMHGYNVTKGG